MEPWLNLSCNEQHIHLVPDREKVHQRKKRRVEHRTHHHVHEEPRSVTCRIVALRSVYERGAFRDRPRTERDHREQRDGIHATQSEYQSFRDLLHCLIPPVKDRVHDQERPDQ